jgi:ligand-binding sensor domain-containing protein
MFAQNSDAIFQRISSVEGLSHNTISRIMQDSLGFMWFATENGLNKYDGYNTVVYKHNSDDTSSIPETLLQHYLSIAKVIYGWVQILVVLISTTNTTIISSEYS